MSDMAKIADIDTRYCRY